VARTLRAKSCLSRQHCTSIAYASIADYFSAKALDPRGNTNSSQFSLRNQPMKISQPANNRDVNRSIQESPQVHRPPASAHPILDKDPISRSIRHHIFPYNRTSRLNHVKASGLRNCTTIATIRIFMSKAWSPETWKSNEISSDAVLAVHAPLK
jgi:hypothetical protein